MTTPAAFKINDLVRLKATTARPKEIPANRGDHPTAQVTRIVDEGGGVYLNRDLAGARYWLATEIELVTVRRVPT